MLDRLWRRGLSVRAADDDRVARGDLPLHLRDDQPEPSGREAAGDRQPAVDDRAGGGQAEPGAAPPLEPDPRTDQGHPRTHGRPSGFEVGPGTPRMATSNISTNRAGEQALVSELSRRGASSIEEIPGSTASAESRAPRTGATRCGSRRDAQGPGWLVSYRDHRLGHGVDGREPRRQFVAEPVTGGQLIRACVAE